MRIRLSTRTQSTLARGGFSLVKERRKNWEEQISSEHNVVMGGTRQDGELRWDEVFTIPASILQATAKEVEKRYRMGRRKTIRIASDNQRGDSQSGNTLCPIIVLTQGFLHVGDKSREIFWFWRNTQIGIIDGSTHKELRGDGCHAYLHFGMPASPFERCGDHHEFVDTLWMANGGLQSHGTAKREAKQVGFFESEMVDEASDIVSHLLKTDGAIREGCASVSIQIDTNDLILLSKRGRKCSEHLKGPKATVKHDQRLASSMNLIVKIDSVYRSVFSCWIVRIGCHEQLLLWFQL